MACLSPLPKPGMTPPNSVMFPSVICECENRIIPLEFEISKQIYCCGVFFVCLVAVVVVLCMWLSKTSVGWSPFPQCKSRVKYNYAYILTYEIHSGGNNCVPPPGLALQWSLSFWKLSALPAHWASVHWDTSLPSNTEFLWPRRKCKLLKQRHLDSAITMAIY